MVIVLADCVARPDAGDTRFYLDKHLEAVARGCGRPEGTPDVRLAFLAGLLHDAAKATPEWQAYIRPGGPKRGPPHAPLGAALFAYWADDLIPRWAGTDRVLMRRLRDVALDWTRVVYDHHGSLDDLEAAPPWRSGSGGIGMRELFDTLDRAGLTTLLHRFFPEACELNGFPAWLEGYEGRWHSWWLYERAGLLREAKRTRAADVPLDSEGLRLAKLGAILVYADRSHVADWEPESFDVTAASAATATLETTLQRRAVEAITKGASAELVAARIRVNAAALAGYRAHAEASVFTLLLPTGFGKTLAGLRVALEACRRGRCRRIVYVAPYLSILSQAAKEIAEAARVEVFIHHHLTAATLEDHQPYDPLDTWQAPVMATTFNQLFRALFPGRAQQCLRRPALDGAFLLIDEPQIIGKEVWNLFLRALAVMCREQLCQVLLLTATLPPSEAGLGFAPVDLVTRAEIGALSADRYVIRAATTKWDAAAAAKEARRCFGKRESVAIILNTVRDACEVYRRAAKAGERNWRFLAAAMLPGHKAKVIADVRRLLRREKAVGVVCTQILEAGVDLSFRCLLRALPILPSVVQAAGRANRHAAASEPAEVVVFDYRREEDKESRNYIYRSENARAATDAVLAAKTLLAEREVPAAMDDYFRSLWAAEPATACLERFERSARGEWSALSGLDPFDGDDSWRVQVFVPHRDGDRFLPPRMARLLHRFAPQGPAQLLERQRDPAFLKTLRDRRDRKRFSALVQQFTVALPKKVVQNQRVATQTDELDWLWVLDNPDDYSEKTGLAHLLGEEDDGPASTII